MYICMGRWGEGRIWRKNGEERRRRDMYVGLDKCHNELTVGKIYCVLNGPEKLPEEIEG